MTPVVSVVVPTAGDHAPLRCVLASLLRQTEVEFEVHVVSDGGPPDTPAVVEEFAARMPPGFMHHHWAAGPSAERVGAGAARNLGARMSRGKRLLFVDGDCVCPDTLVESHAYHHTRPLLGRLALIGLRRHVPPENAEALFSQGYEWETLHAREHLTAPDRRSARSMDKHVRNSSVGVCHFAWTCHVSYPADKFKAVGGFWEKMRGSGYEDLELAVRAWRVGVRFAIISSPQVYHLDHPQSPLQAEHAQANKVLFRQTLRDKAAVVRGRLM